MKWVAWGLVFELDFMFHSICYLTNVVWRFHRVKPAIVYYSLYVNYIFWSTENWSHFFFSEGKNKQEEFKHAHVSCIYCTELAVEPHAAARYVSTAPSVFERETLQSWRIKRCKNQREQSEEMFTCRKTVDTSYCRVSLTERLWILVGGRRTGAVLTDCHLRLGY